MQIQSKVFRHCNKKKNLFQPVLTSFIRNRHHGSRPAKGDWYVPIGSGFDTMVLFQNQITETQRKENIQKYNSDTNVLAKWLDTTVTLREGKAYPLMTNIVPKEKGIPFPFLECFPLQSLIDGTSQKTYIPEAFNNDSNKKQVKIIFFSFKHYGFSIVRSWLDSFSNDQIFLKTSSYELCFIEFSFLSMAKGFFANNIAKLLTKEQSEKTFLKFGGIAVSLLMKYYFVVFCSVSFSFFSHRILLDHYFYQMCLLDIFSCLIKIIKSVG